MTSIEAIYKMIEENTDKIIELEDINRALCEAARELEEKK